MLPEHHDQCNREQQENDNPEYKEVLKYLLGDVIPRNSYEFQNLHWQVIYGRKRDIH